MIVGILVAGFYAKKKQFTTYTAKSSVMVGQNLKSTDYKNSAVQAELGMMKSYEEVLESNKTMTLARQTLSKHDRKDISAKDLGSAVSVHTHPGSLVLSISATSSSKVKSVKMANAVAKVAQQRVSTYSPVASKVQVVSMASKNDIDSTTKPSVKKYAVLGAALGLLVGMVVSFSLTNWKGKN